MAVTMFGGDLRTGLIRVRNIPVTGASASAKVGNAGAVSCDMKFPMIDPQTQVPIPLLSILSPTKSFLAYKENGKVVNAGPIWNEVSDLDANTVTLNAAGLRSYWDYRNVIPALIDSDRTSLPIGKDTALLNYSYGTIAKRLVQQAQSWTSGSVPIVFESDVLGDYVRNYAGEDLKNLGEALDQLSGVINGPDIAFRPRITVDGSHLEWVMMTGVPLSSPGAPHVFDMTVPGAAVRGAKRVRDGSAIVTDNYQTGSVPADDSDAKALMAKSVDTLLTRPAELVNTTTDPNGVRAVTTYRGVTSSPAAPVTAGTGSGPAGTGVTTFARATAGGAATYLDIRAYPAVHPLTPGTNSIAASYWTRSSVVGSPRALIVFYAADGVTIVGTITAVQAVNVANAWQLHQVTATVPVGAVSYEVISRNVATIASGDTIDMTLLTTLENQAGVTPFSGGTVADADHEFAWNGTPNAATSSRWNTGGYPRMESSVDRSSVTELDTLQEYADAAVKLGEKMTETWTFSARKTSAPRLEDYSEGDFCTLRTKSAILGSGPHDLRIMEISVKMGDQFASITCAPVRA
jgi:hypothetical protein